MSVYAAGAVSGLDRLMSMSPDEYANAEPFPHAVIHGMWDESTLEQVLAEFPTPDAMGTQFDGAEEVKSAESRWECFGPATRDFLANLNSEPFVDALEHLSGISGLITDHQFRGGGQHQIRAGGYLGIHADFNRHRKLNISRRLNVLVYLNHDWDDAWGGQLELWDKAMTHAVVRVSPAFNTTVIFSTNSDSFHGHPDALTCPPGVTRRSIATYYYTPFASNEREPDPHSTLFQDRPGVTPRRAKVEKAKDNYRIANRLYREGTRMLVPDEWVERIKRVVKND